MSDTGTLQVARVELRGEVLTLFPEKVAYWEGRGTLLVADPHWGKAATFRAAGIPIPRGTTAEGLSRLDAVLRRTGAQRVVFLGDFLHAREGRAAATLEMLRRWRVRHATTEMLLVRGNHDRHAGDPPAELGIACVEEPVSEPPFVLAHRPATTDAGYVLCGHLHPGVDLVGPGRQYERLPCFWFGATGAVLPAFGDFTGLWPVSPTSGDRVFVVAGAHVIERYTTED